MKIPEQQSQQAANIVNVKRVKPAGATFSLYGNYFQTKGPDKATVSSFAQEIQKVSELLKRTPDVREEKVQAIKEKLANGSYNVSAPDVVEALFRLSREEK